MNQSQYLEHLKRCEVIKSGPVYVEIEEKEPRYIRVIDAAILILAIVCIAALLSHWSSANATEQSEAHKASAERYSSLLAECMSGGTLFDKTSNTAFFCGKAIELVNP